MKCRAVTVNEADATAPGAAEVLDRFRVLGAVVAFHKDRDRSMPLEIGRNVPNCPTRTTEDGEKQVDWRAVNQRLTASGILPVDTEN